jgi:hypothetical protein
MSKMASHEPFGHLQHKLWSKKGPGVKLAVWLPTTKSLESTRPRCVQVECDTPLKRSWRELQIFLRPHPKVPGVQIGTVSRFPLGKPEIKSHSDGVWRNNTENTIWRKVVASPKFGPWWIKWVRVARGLSQHQKCFRMWTNQLVGWFWCRTK